jgi:hypothetical protein
MYILLFILLSIFFIFCIFCIINTFLVKKEHFCKINNVNRFGDINDPRVLLNYPEYLAQSDIKTSSCNEYWKEWPLESNSNLIENNANVIFSDQLQLPKEKQFGSNDYTSGFVDFTEFASYLNDVIDPIMLQKIGELIGYSLLKERRKDDSEEIYNSAVSSESNQLIHEQNNNLYQEEYDKEQLIDPLTNKKTEYQYEVNFGYYKLNEKTWVNRWDKYNPSIKVDFPYIESPIKDINMLNQYFLKKCNDNQRFLLTNKLLVQFGVIPFQIYKYKILHIKYLSNKLPIYVIKVMLFRETYLYSTSFSYIGYVENNQSYIVDVKFIGRNSNDDILLPNHYNSTLINQQIINKNYDNMSEINKNQDSIVSISKKQKEDYKIKNQYACFNMNFDTKLNNNAILPYFARDTCESNYDPYGKQKEIGVYDSPCKKNEDCPFYKSNQNYPNEFGKCLETGYCELPVNMERIGYKYFKNKKDYKPLCYNCDSKELRIGTSLNDCCSKQYNKEQYPFLKSPDYAFQDDFLDRKNYFEGRK